jgi:hypothetical protein
MRFDMTDPERLTRRTDIAFWLHLLAALLIVHSFIGGVLDVGSKLEPKPAVAVVAVFLALSFVAVLIDRRALLVSGLAYAGGAFWTLIRQAGLFRHNDPSHNPDPRCLRVVAQRRLEATSCRDI